MGTLYYFYDDIISDDIYILSMMKVFKYTFEQAHQILFYLKVKGVFSVKRDCNINKLNEYQFKAIDFGILTKIDFFENEGTI